MGSGLKGTKEVGTKKDEVNKSTNIHSWKEQPPTLLFIASGKSNRKGRQPAVSESLADDSKGREGLS